MEWSLVFVVVFCHIIVVISSFTFNDARMSSLELHIEMVHKE